MKYGGLRRVLSLLALVACPDIALAEPLVQRVEDHSNAVGEIEKRPGDFVHRASGFVYPTSLAEMPARKTVTYGTGDAAVYYTLLGGANGDPWIDLFVYPAILDFRAERQEIESALTNGKFKARPGPAPDNLPPLPAGGAEGWFKGFDGQSEYLTGYRLIRSGDWYVKARISVPRKGGRPSLERALKGIGAIPWTQQLRPGAAIKATPEQAETL